jgi:AbrB family looped-hinge helix DNA binding protein
MIVTLSSKGQIVIPKAIRRALALRPGAKFEVELNDERILFKPVVEKPSFEAALAALYGKFAGSDLLDMLEKEHQWEIARDAERSARLLDPDRTSQR